MATQFIGLKELRQNMAKITTRAALKRHRVIVLKKNRPLFELRPLSSDDVTLLTFQQDIEQAQKSVREGKTYSTKQVREMLGLKPYDV